LAPVGSQFTGEGVNEDWEVGDTLAQWWRPNFETFMYPFLPGHVTRPKECKKLYLIQLPKKSLSPFPPFPLGRSFHPFELRLMCE
jgi:cleavage and polyadenylation specificity factor subunit 5